MEFMGRLAAASWGVLAGRLPPNTKLREYVVPQKPVENKRALNRRPTRDRATPNPP